MNRQGYDILSSQILNSALAVHKEMGPGLLEAVYQQCLVKEFKMRDIVIDTMVMIPLIYKG